VTASDEGINEIDMLIVGPAIAVTKAFV